MRVGGRSSRRTREAMQSLAISAAWRVTSLGMTKLYIQHERPRARATSSRGGRARTSSAGRDGQPAREVLHAFIELGAALGRVHALRGRAERTGLQALQL